MAEIRDDEGHPVVPTVVPPATESPGPRSAVALSAHTSRSLITPGQPSPLHTLQNPSTGDTMATPEQHRSHPSSATDSTCTTRRFRPVLPPKARTEAARTIGSQARYHRGLGRSQTGGNLTTSPHGSDNDESSSSDSDEEWATNKKERHEGKQTDQTMEALSGWKPLRHRRRKNKIEPQHGQYSRFSIGNDYFRTKGKVGKRDGRLNISVNETTNSGYLAKALGASIKHHLLPGHKEGLEDMNEIDEERYSVVTEDIIEDDRRRPRLNLVVIVIGSRGDIQPFLKIGKILQNHYGHRVRIATHPAFKDFVEKDSGLEFFSVGGDPSELMAFMVKNPGLVPSLETVRAGEIGRRRASMYEMFNGMWRACINATDDETDEQNMRMMGAKQPFIADAIIANPPSFAHIHIAERLGVPLHIMFTFPYTPTQQFPHPLANIKKSNVDRNYTNFMSYPLVELMTWQGLGDLVNKFRKKTLGLEPVSTLWAPGQLYRLKVPHTYLWSPGLVPKPRDWGPEIDISGFVFLELASTFEPPEELVRFLEAGEPPVYIGFGSIVVDDPDSFTHMIFEAVQIAGVRALVSKGWGGLGSNDLNVPENIILLENTPHDWLFPKCSAVVHHGGAGTTAIGLKCGKPTMIVPFFGDQPFWGSMVAEARAGAFKCVPYKKLTAEKLAEGIKQCLTEEAKKNVQKIAESIAKEGDGALNAVKSFHRSLPLRGEHSMRCSILENRVAVWQLKNTSLRLSALAAEILVEKKRIKWTELQLIRHCQWNDFDGPGEPITGGSTAIYRTVADAGKGIVLVPIRANRVIKRRFHHHQKKKKWAERMKRSERPENNGNTSEAEQYMSLPTDTTSAKDFAAISSDDENKEAPASARPHGPKREDTQLSALSADPSENVFEELAEGTGASLKKTGAAIVKAPMDLSLAVAQGFHNAPRLYGDETVRRPRRIDDLASGLKAGRDEFIYGIYDGVTGLGRLPMKGMREDGMLGCLEGFGMGVGGLVLKSIAGFIGPFAYASKGVQREMQKKKQPIAFIRRARILQGANEIRALREKSVLGRVATAQTGRQSMEEPRTTAANYAADPRPGDYDADNASADRAPTDTQPSSDESLTDIEANVDRGWQIVLDLLHAVEKRKREGLLGRVTARKETKKWQDSGALESVYSAEAALKAKRQGKDVAEQMGAQKREVSFATKKPRRPGMEGESKVEGQSKMEEERQSTGNQMLPGVAQSDFGHDTNT